MLKNLWFQLHWLLGIFASVVLAIVGVTGAMLSFETEILRALNPGVLTVPVQASPVLDPAALLARVQAAAPDRRVTAVSVSGVPGNTARVTFAPAGGPGRGETRYADPYSGALLGTPRGQEFFRTTMRLHRWLAMDEPGKHIVGAATVALVILSLTGLYLRWPRRPLDWRAWLRVDFKRRGRNLLWDLHSVAGTIAVVPYLVMGLTGLYWSYDWYRGALFDLAGMQRPGGERPGMQQQGSQPSPRGERRAPAAAPAASIGTAWASFQREVPAYRVASLRLPARPGQPFQIVYQTPDAPHERANNTLVLDMPAGTVRDHRRYAALPLPQKLVTSIFALHSGSFFGIGGVVLFMLSSLAMPLFAITGWMLYLDRRSRKSAVRSVRPAQAVSAAGESILIGFASQSGTAERLAWQSATALSGAGMAVAVAPLWRIDPSRLAGTTRALFVVSTFGDGQPPDLMRGFARMMKGRTQPLAGLSFGLLALGDRSYRRFCGFGRDFDRWLRQQGAQPLFDRVEVDNGDAGALRHWQGHLGRLADSAELPDWERPRYQQWRLAARRLSNPGSVGWPCYHIELTPPDGAALDWQAGDIAEIGPAHGRADVDAFLSDIGLDAAESVSWNGEQRSLADVVASAILPSVEASRGLAAQALADTLRPLPHREYSIASLPGDGRIDLLVRQMRAPDGRPGLGSFWLTEHAPVGAAIAVRVRRNTSFRPPPDDRPLLLIGNGTGIAGLRAHLKDRARLGHMRNWLIFGERQRACDFHYADDIQAWRSAGVIRRLDLAFSRDQDARVYVQHCLRDAATDLRTWVDEGAEILVCGSLEGMAPDVDAALRDLIGDETVERLAADGRYRRDVY